MKSTCTHLSKKKKAVHVHIHRYFFANMILLVLLNNFDGLRIKKNITSYSLNYTRTTVTTR